MKKPIKQAILDAVAWLRANPDKHITVSLAKDRVGNSVDPTAPEASCFCAYGRVMHEAGVPDSERLTLERHCDLEYAPVWNLNDGYHYGDTKDVVFDLTRAAQGLGQPYALDYLEKLANSGRFDNVEC